MPMARPPTIRAIGIWAVFAIRRCWRLATDHATGFLRDFGDHPALYRLDGKPIMSFVHEAYYRNSVPEFGGPAMQPSCYCAHCRAAFRDYLAARGLNPDVEPPRDPSDPALWQHWLNCHAEAIPRFSGSPDPGDQRRDAGLVYPRAE